MKGIVCYGFLLMLICYLLFPGLTHASILAAERQALIALYNSTNGDSWTDKSGWKDLPLAQDGFAMQGTENTWFGVSTDSGNTTVVQIALTSNNLVGTLPSQLGDLNNLEGLYLGENQLTEGIPSEFGNLTKLLVLQLHRNQLSGGIISELGNSSNLSELLLHQNQLSGPIPSALGNLTNMRTLWLSNNRLNGTIPPELGNLTDLGVLLLDQNKLTGSIPDELGNLSRLVWLDFHSNQLTGSIPQQLMNLTNLIDNESDICGNHLFTNNEALRDFLNSKQIGGDWESCQTETGMFYFIPNQKGGGAVIYLE